nr:serine/threonine-protein kinase HT1-like [Ipomoea batatas]
MDLRTSVDGGEVPKGDNSGHQVGELGSPLMGAGSVSARNMAEKSPSKDMIFRADKVDLKSLDVQLEKHLSRVWSRSVEHQVQRPKEAWEIDPSKLEIRYLIAQGTYGTVYRGTYDTQDVAVKLLDWGEDGMATAAETAALRASFQQEVAVWQKLDHPNVTSFVGASMGTSNLKIPSKNPSEGYTTLPSRSCCVVVEFLAGGTLKNLLYKNRKKKLAFKIVIQLALDLSRGLSYLHSKKIVHRDVKAENMLLDTSRNLKIADFGVARVEAQNPKDMTGETGTLGYMAPEVLDGKPYNRKCDVYSFGVCLWEIYCCDLPYPDLSFAEVSSAVVRQNLRPEIPRCCPSSLASIMKKCWDANPDKRPEMDEVVSLEKGIASEAHHYQTLPLSSMLPPFVCNSTTSKGPSRKASMKVVHRFGPCSARTQDSPTMTELLRYDESRVNSINARVKSLISLANNTKGDPEKTEMSESKAVNLPAGHESPGGVGNYVVTVGLGTPKKDLDLAFDTGSHITWTQCKPCAAKCYQQRAPIFDPAASTTYSNVTCSSAACSGLTSATNYPPRCTPPNTCVYIATYGDRTFSVGELAKDTLTLSSTEAVDGFIFGCGQNNQLFYGENAGLMGLGRDPLSIVSQTSQQYGNYFSYCLPTKTNTDGHLTLGKSSETSNVKYTPLLSSQGTGEAGLYFIDVLAISVAGRDLKINPAVFKSGKTIIDSGTVTTRLPPTAYTALRDAFREEMTMFPKVETNTSFDTCYDFSKYRNPTIPKISFTFGGNAVVDLDPAGVMTPVDESGSLVCLAFFGNKDDGELGIFGNLQQQTLEVVYDVAGGKLGFASGGCS